MKAVLTFAAILIGAANAQNNGPSAELNKLQAWCPLDHKLTGLNLGYCNEDKNETEAGDLLEASEHHAAKLLFGGKGPGEKCGLCSFLSNENSCGLTSKKVPLTFDLAIKRDEFASMRRWCLLGKANMDVCRNFGSEGAGKTARLQMCTDLKAKKFQLDGLRALEFSSGSGESIADIVNALGQEKTYSFLGLGGCLQLLEKNIVLRHVFKKLRPDACAVICVRAMDNPERNVMEVAADVYKGFVSAGQKILAHHKSEYNRTNISQVLGNEKKLLKVLTTRQVAYKSNLTTAQHKERAIASQLSSLGANESVYRREMLHYIQRAEEYRKNREKFLSAHVTTARVKLPSVDDKDLRKLVYSQHDEESNAERRSSIAQKLKLNQTKKLASDSTSKPKAVHTSGAKKLNQTEIALAALRKEMNRKFKDDTKKLIAHLKEEKDEAVTDAALNLAKYEEAYTSELEKVKQWTPEPHKKLLKSQ